MPDFRLIPEEGLRARLDAEEAGLLRELIAEMNTLLEAEVPRADAVKKRLFPDAYEDREEAEKYQDLVGDDLVQRKKEALRIVRERIGSHGSVETSIPEPEIPEWLALLTDLRLAIGTRLEVDDAKMEAEFDPNDPNGPAISVLHWLGWIQSAMLEAIGWE
jgi:hypothetical protein